MQCDALLGLFALTRIHLLVDRRNGFVYTRPVADPTDRYPYNNLGATFVPANIDDEKDNDLLARVMKDSPAGRADLRDNDVLLKIQGRGCDQLAH